MYQLKYFVVFSGVFSGVLPRVLRQFFVCPGSGENQDQGINLLVLILIIAAKPFEKIDNVSRLHHLKRL